MAPRWLQNKCTQGVVFEDPFVRLFVSFSCDPGRASMRTDCDMRRSTHTAKTAKKLCMKNGKKNGAKNGKNFENNDSIDSGDTSGARIRVRTLFQNPYTNS